MAAKGKLDMHFSALNLLKPMHFSILNDRKIIVVFKKAVQAYFLAFNYKLAYNVLTN